MSLPMKSRLQLEQTKRLTMPKDLDLMEKDTGLNILTRWRKPLSKRLFLFRLWIMLRILRTLLRITDSYSIDQLSPYSRMMLAKRTLRGIAMLYSSIRPDLDWLREA